MRASAFSCVYAAAALAAAAAIAGCSGGILDTSTTQVAANAAPAAPEMQMTDIKVGTGISPRPGQTCIVHYTGWVYENGVKGKKFDSSVDRKRAFSFVLGDHKVIEGWERGVGTMKAGGKRTLIIPPALAYGSAGQGASIPPNATLLFEVELIDVKAAT